MREGVYSICLCANTFIDQMQRPSIQRKPDNSNLSSFSFESETMDLKSLFGDGDDQYTIESLTNTTDNHLDSDIYHLEEREQSILKGLKYIFTMSQNSKNFSSFGNDIIQCFYDISQVHSESTENEGTRSLKSRSRISRCITSKRSATYGSYILKKRAGRTTPSPQYKKC